MSVIINIIKIISVIFLMYSYVCEPLRCGNCPELPEEEILEMRFEYIKNNILKKMHLAKAPRVNLPKPSRRALLKIAEMAEKQTGSETNQNLKTESVIIYPGNDNFTCLEKTSLLCSRLQYSVPENIFPENYVSAEIWIYKPGNQSIQVHQIISDHSQNLTFSLKLDDVEESTSVWSKYRVYKYNVRTIVLEIIYELEKNEEDKPFLNIQSKKPEVSFRKRRSEACTLSGTSCCKEDFYLNFSKIGWDNWILHPDGYMANFCRGRCFNDLSNSRFYHSSVLLSYIRDNKDLAEEIGLTMCCTPSTMAPMTIIYQNEEGLIYHKSIENMKVEACDCA